MTNEELIERVRALRAECSYLVAELAGDGMKECGDAQAALQKAADWLGDVTEPLTEAEQQRYNDEVFPSLDEQVRELNGRELCELVSDAMSASDKRDAMLYMNDE